MKRWLARVLVVMLCLSLLPAGAMAEAALDITGDGNVNNKDLNRLMKYLADDTTEIH